MAETFSPTVMPFNPSRTSPKNELDRGCCLGVIEFLEVLRERLLRAWADGPHARLPPKTFCVPFTSKLISGGFT